MSWSKHDINNPELYMPRPNPRVTKAEPQILWDQAEDDLGLALSGGYALMADNESPEGTDDFVYDDELRWNEPIAGIEVRTETVQKSLVRPKTDREVHAPLRAQVGSPGKESSRAPKKKGLPKRGRGNGGWRGWPYLYAGIIAGCVLAMSLIMVMMMPQLAGYFWRDLDNYAFINGELLRYDKKAAETYKQYRDYMQQDIIYPGIFVDGTHVGGMTIEQAKQAVSGTNAEPGSFYSVTVSIGNQSWVIDQTNVPATRDLGNTLQKAFAVGRTNTTAILGTNQTPFRERVTTAMDLRENGVNLLTPALFDQTALRAKVDEITAFVTREPKNADIQSFDFATRTFAFSDEQVGVTLNADILYEKIANSLRKREQGTTLTADPVIQEPTITKAQLVKDFKMIAAYTTDTTSDKNRNNNIDLASRAINGTALLPGETFSFNKTTGQRTTDKGYREAGAISAGQTIDEVGGGICQVSSTLFNAVARANLEITSRSPHAWPSTYVNRGEDATVNWPNLDFQFKNNRTTPVFVITYYKDRKCSAEIWGMSLGDGITIDLKSEIVKTMEPPSEVNYVNNTGLPFGTSKETIKARTGYIVDTYKVWYQNGKETKREKMHTSTYKAYQRTVEYN